MSAFWIDFIDENGKYLTESISVWDKNCDLEKLRHSLIKEHYSKGHIITMINCKKYIDESNEEHF
jgi:hypothetical protein